MARGTVRLTDQTLTRLDGLARELGTSRAALVRRVVEGALEGVPMPELEPPAEGELLGLLSEKARQGNVAAIRTLLAREEQADPRERALLAFEQLAAGRQQ
jgi:hypothetical protein